MIQEWLGEVGVDLHAIADGFLVVVGASFDLRTLEQTLGEQLRIDVKADDSIECLAMLGEVLVEGLNLVHVAWVAVQQEAVGGIVLVQSIGDDGIGELIGDEVASVHDGLDLLAELGAVLDIGAEHVPGGDGRDTVVLGNCSGLSSLAGARGAHDEHSHDVRNPS